MNSTGSWLEFLKDLQIGIQIVKDLELEFRLCRNSTGSWMEFLNELINWNSNGFV